MSPTWENTSPYDQPGGGGPQFMLPRMTQVTKLLMLGLGGVWLLSFLFYAPAPQAYRSIEAWLGLDTNAWFSAPLYLPIWQLVTYGVLHSPTGFGHIFYNLLVLYFFGTMLEERLGPRRFGTFFAGAVLAGGFTTMVLRTLGLFPDVLVVGASAGVLAVVVACAVETPNRTVLLLFFPVPLKFLAGGLVLLDVLSTYASLFQPMAGGTDTLAHLGGVAFGFLMAKKRWMWNDLGEAFQEKRQVRAEANEAADQERLDQLLERISRDGIHSLSASEKKFLNRMSERQRGSGPPR